MDKSFDSGWFALRSLTLLSFAEPLKVDGSISHSVTQGMHRLANSLLSFIIVTVLCIPVYGCVTTTRAGYSASDAAIAEVDGFDNIRGYADAPAGSLGDQTQWLPRPLGKNIRVLCISGGGSGGAFTVGVLSAWSDRHTRPEFDVVTGVSTGALIAPYAFLGSAYDKSLADISIGGQAKELVDKRWIGSGLLGTSLLKGERLRQLVSTYITNDILQKIAAEHRRGRRLLVLTTNLDSQRGVVWNMGAIANSGRPDALALFRDIMIASASIPGVFPAVTIKAKSGSKQIEELHSDGGSSTQFFGVPDAVLASPDKPRPLNNFHPEMYVIVNNALMPEFVEVTNSTLSVAGRAYATMVKSQTKQALLALYNHGQRTGIRLRIAWIDKQIPYSMLDPFNAEYMRAVYTDGYNQTMSGTIWKNAPVF